MPQRWPQERPGFRAPCSLLHLGLVLVVVLAFGEWISVWKISLSLPFKQNENGWMERQIVLLLQNRMACFKVQCYYSWISAQKHSIITSPPHTHLQTQSQTWPTLLGATAVSNPCLNPVCPCCDHRSNCVKAREGGRRRKVAMKMKHHPMARL